MFVYILNNLQGWYANKQKNPNVETTLSFLLNIKKWMKFNVFNEISNFSLIASNDAVIWIEMNENNYNSY